MGKLFLNAIFLLALRFVLPYPALPLFILDLSQHHQELNRSYEGAGMQHENCLVESYRLVIYEMSEIARSARSFSALDRSVRMLFLGCPGKLGQRPLAGDTWKIITVICVTCR